MRSHAWRTRPARCERAIEVACIGKGKASAPYEFGIKASIVTTNGRGPGGQFVLHAKALPGNPYDGHTLGEVIDATETLTGCPIERAYVDKGYRGHNATAPRRVSISGQKRGVFGIIKRELRRRSAIESVIGQHEERRTSPPLLSQGVRGRCRQRHSLRRRPQSPPRPRLAEAPVAPNLERLVATPHRPDRAQMGFLTDD